MSTYILKVIKDETETLSPSELDGEPTVVEKETEMYFQRFEIENISRGHGHDNERFNGWLGDLILFMNGKALNRKISDIKTYMNERFSNEYASVKLFIQECKEEVMEVIKPKNYHQKRRGQQDERN